MGKMAKRRANNVKKKKKTTTTKTTRIHEGNRGSQNPVVGRNCSDHLIYH